LLYKNRIVTIVLVGIGSLSQGFLYAATPTRFDNKNELTQSIPPAAPALMSTPRSSILASIQDVPVDEIVHKEIIDSVKQDTSRTQTDETVLSEQTSVFSVPFYSQFSDITSAAWQKVGCGIASLAMLIEFYEPGAVTVDTLLKEGIAAHAYLSDAGWTHAGLIGLSHKYGLEGESRDMSALSMDEAFDELQTVLANGPVMASVHYTFDPKNPIPHLVVVSGINDGKVYFNDPADAHGDESISIQKFENAWKKRYIEVHPIS
jgi:predicted double-glycine peptidase